MLPLSGELVPSALPRRAVVLACVGFIVVGALIRFHHLGSRSLQQDEPATVALAVGRMDDAIEIKIAPISTLFVRASMDALGVNAWAARLPSALLGVLSMVLATWVGWRVYGRTGALLTAGLLVIHPWHVYYSQTARYPIYVFFFAVTFLLGASVSPQGAAGRWGRVSLLTVSAIAGLASHLSYAFFLVPCAAVALWSMLPRERRVLGAAVTVSVAAGALLFLRDHATFVAGKLSIDPRSALDVVSRFVLYMGPLFVLLSGLEGARAVRQPGYSPSWPGRSLAVHLAVILVLAGIARIQMRFFGGSLALVTLCTVGAFTTIIGRAVSPPRFLPWLGAAIALALVNVPALASYERHEGYKPGLKECLEIVSKDLQPSDLLVLHGPKTESVPFYLTGRDVRSQYPQEVTPQDLEAAGRIWTIWSTQLPREPLDRLGVIEGATLVAVIPGGTPFEPYATLLFRKPGPASRAPR